MMDRLPIKTTFGPEEGRGTLNYQLDRELNKKNDLFAQLTEQMTDNSNKRQGERAFSIEMDHMDLARNRLLMANQRQTANQHLLDAKEHWRKELQNLHNFKK